MPIQVTCSQCGRTYAVPDDRAGKTGRCPCGALIAIPAPTALPPPLAAPPPPPSDFADLDQGPSPAWAAPAPPPPYPVAAPPVAPPPSDFADFDDSPPAPWAAGPPLPPAPLAPPGVGPPRARAQTDRALVHYVQPLSFIKNMIPMTAVVSLAGNGLGLIVGRLAPAGAPAMLVGSGRLQIVQVVLGLIGAVIGPCVLVLLINLAARWANGIPIRFRQLSEWRSGVAEVTAIKPLSVLAAGAVFGALTGLLVAVIMVGAMGLTRQAAMSGIGLLPTAGGPVMLAVMPLIMAAQVGVGWCLAALVYGPLARAWGGIRFETVAGG